MTNYTKAYEVIRNGSLTMLNAYAADIITVAKVDKYNATARRDRAVPTNGVEVTNKDLRAVLNMISMGFKTSKHESMRLRDHLNSMKHNDADAVNLNNVLEFERLSTKLMLSIGYTQDIVDVQFSNEVSMIVNTPKPTAETTALGEAFDKIISVVAEPVVAEPVVEVVVDRKPTLRANKWTRSGYSYSPVNAFVVDTKFGSNHNTLAVTLISGKNEEITMEDFPMTPFNQNVFNYLTANKGKKVGVIVAKKGDRFYLASDIMTKFPTRYMSAA